MAVISFDKLTKTYKTGFRKKKTALKDFSLDIREGEVFGFLGPNGAGKSTAIKILLNLIFPTAGKAEILGSDVGEKEIRRSVGYLPENPYFYDYLNPVELLSFAGRASNMDSLKIREKTESLLNTVGLWNERKRAIRSYSKGMVQRVGLALALIHDPKVVILDEPMTGLDPIGRKQVIDLILKLKSEGKTIFFSSHILEDIERICDRIGMLVNGQLRRVIDFKKEKLIKSLEDTFIEEVEKAGGLQQ
ncbi:MAG: ABC transporter ATP-binding protein [Deltaproteobacteria bacterium]|nr:ABC transporter ATP-binding protein [Deltaproteobacteria bacterium]